MKGKSQTKPSLPDQLPILLSKLLKEPFSKKHAFSALSLLEVGNILEEQKETEDYQDQSYQQSNQIFCEILFELERLNLVDYLIVPLSEIVEEDDEDEDTSSALSSPVASEYANFQEQKLVRGSESYRQSGALERFRGLARLFTVEAESFYRIGPGIKRLWTTRKNAVHSLLNTNTQDLQFHPELATALRKISEAHPQWLYKGQVSHVQLLESLRYLVQTPKIEMYIPVPLDFGLLCFFFGQDRVLHQFPVRNLMGLSGLSSDELTELFFRFSRAQKLKVKFNHANRKVLDVHIKILEEDTTRLLTLVKKLRT